MKLAFNGQGHYTDYSKGYEIYVRRSRKGGYVDEKTYHRIVRRYCGWLAESLLEYGIIDLPSEMGSIAACTITRKPQYRGKKFIGYGKMDWATGHFDGKLKTFGLVYLPRHTKHKNLRCYGFVANRQLFRRMKGKFEDGASDWHPIEFNDDMI